MDLSTFLQRAAEQHYTLSLHDGILSGAGAKLLREAAQASQFFIIGEEHGVAEIPQISAALLREYRALGYRYFCAEISPWMARRLTKILTTQGLPGLQAIVRDDPVFVPFYGWAEDAELLLSLLQAEQVLWGVDQEFLFSAQYLLAELLEMARDAAAQRLVSDVLERARGLRQAQVPDLFVLQGLDLEPYKSAFAGQPEALEILSAMEISFRIYYHFFRASQGEAEYQYHNNDERERLMKVSFMRCYRAAQQQTQELPRALLRFGDTHASRGLSPTRVYSLGNFVAELAIANGSQIFNVWMIAGPQAQVRSNDGLSAAEAARAAWLQPLLERVSDEAWNLFDLRPLRPILGSRSIDGLPAQLADLIWRYDALLVLNHSQPASLLQG